ncbi:MAG: hypothetical protein KVP17_004406 [Porospora cf. gigantea B]|uniref:uncharacterized protein n=1 Tax=Porospora cf. gigantea B TaxID=2853592 RepID=UPI003571B9CC|nr:MAG: hypothetical protein KVP17_004406 [Porospora cf. gigantea B]
MLQLEKNLLVTSATKRQVEIHQLELDWYTNNYSTLSTHSALFVGFSFAQMTAETPENVAGSTMSLFMALTTASLGFHLVVVISSAFCCMFGPGMALRGDLGCQSVSLAVANMRAGQKTVFTLFLLGMICFFLSNAVQLHLLYGSFVGAIGAHVLLWLGAATLVAGLHAFLTLR